MDLASAKMIGAGLATMGVLGAGIGIGVLFGNFVNAGIRNPAAAKTQSGLMRVHNVTTALAAITTTARQFGAAACAITSAVAPTSPIETGTIAPWMIARQGASRNRAQTPLI